MYVSCDGTLCNRNCFLSSFSSWTKCFKRWLAAYFWELLKYTCSNLVQRQWLQHEHWGNVSLRYPRSFWGEISSFVGRICLHAIVSLQKITYQRPVGNMKIYYLLSILNCPLYVVYIWRVFFCKETLKFILIYLHTFTHTYSICWVCMCVSMRVCVHVYMGVCVYLFSIEITYSVSHSIV